MRIEQHCWHESYALQALLCFDVRAQTGVDSKFCIVQLASCKTLGSFLPPIFTVDDAVRGKFRHPVLFLKHTHGHRKPRERYAPQGEFSQEETRPSSQVSRRAMRSGPACEFKRTDGHEYWRYFLLEQRGEESCGRRGGFPTRGAKWAFEEIYGRLAALQASGAAPIIEAWLAGELPLTSFP